MAYAGFEKRGQVFYDVKKDGKVTWYGVVDRCPIAPGHIHLRYDRECELAAEDDFFTHLENVSKALKAVFHSDWRDDFKRLAKQFPTADGAYKTYVWYRLGLSDRKFHVHVVPLFAEQDEAATSCLHSRFKQMKNKNRSGGMLFWLGLQEHEKDARDASGQRFEKHVSCDEWYDLELLVKCLQDEVKK